MAQKKTPDIHKRPAFLSRLIEPFQSLPREMRAVLLFSLVINAIGISWGLPSHYTHTWAPDEILPPDVFHGIIERFQGEWYNRYPPLQYYLITITYLPFYPLNSLGILDIHSKTALFLSYLIERSVSLWMAFGTIFLIYRCGTELFDKRTAIIPAFMAALLPAFIYYAKTANLDVPYLFWFVFSLLYYIRILKHHRSRDYYLFTLTAVLAACTKDQAAGLYVLSPIPLVLSMSRTFKTGSAWVRLRKAIFNRKWTFSVILAVLLFMLIYLLPFNIRGCLHHFSVITGTGTAVFRIFENTVSGHIQMLIHAFRHIQFSFGWPVFILCLTGVLREIFRKNRNTVLNSLWIFPISYYLTFISNIGYHYVRFFLPVCMILVFFGTSGMLYVTGLFKKRIKPVLVIFMLVFLYTAVYAISVDILMIRDSRYSAEKWLNTHVGKEDRIAMVGWAIYLPRMGTLNGIYLRDASWEELNAFDPDFVVLNSRFCKCDLLAERIRRGDWNYSLIYEYDKVPFPAGILVNDIVKKGRKRIDTNLDKINPSIQIYKKLNTSYP